MNVVHWLEKILTVHTRFDIIKKCIQKCIYCWCYCLRLFFLRNWSVIVFSVAFGIELHTTEYHWFSNSSISNGASALRFLLRLTYPTINLLEKRFKVQCTNGISVVIWSRLYLLLVCSYRKYCHFYINSKVSRNHCLRKESS